MNFSCSLCGSRDWPNPHSNCPLCRSEEPEETKTKNMKIKVWLDSGANAQSKRVETFELSDLGISDEEWGEMDDEEQEAFARELAFDHLEWGFETLD